MPAAVIPGRPNDGVAVRGSNIRYASLGTQTIAGSASAPTEIIDIGMSAIMYRFVFATNSGAVRFRIVVDGQQITPGPDGLLLSDVAGLGIGASVAFDFGQFATNRWIWSPAEPVQITSSMMLQMRSDDASTKNFLGGIASYREIP